MHTFGFTIKKQFGYIVVNSVRDTDLIVLVGGTC